VDAHHRAYPDPERAGDRGGLQAQRAERAVHGVLVVPDAPVRRLPDAAGVLLGVDHEHPRWADDEVVDGGSGIAAVAVILAAMLLVGRYHKALTDEGSVGCLWSVTCAACALIAPDA
jgi:hypothetical protein